MRRSGAGLLALLLPLVAAAPAVAEEPPPLTLVEAARLALERHPSVALARAGLDATAARTADARAERIPDLAAQASVVQHGDPVPVTPIHGFGPDAFPEFDESLVQGGLTLRHTFWDGGARGARIAAGEAGEAGSAAALDQATGDLLARTVGLYLRLSTLQELLAAHEARRSALEEELERVQRTLAAGRAAEVDLRRVEAALAGAEADQVAVRVELATAERDLARLLGLPAEAAHVDRLAPVSMVPADPPTRDPLVDLAVSRRPAVRRAETEVAQARAAVTLAASAGRPKIGGEAVLQELGAFGADFATEWNAGLRVTLPLFDGGGVAARVAEAEARKRQAEERLRLVRDEAAADVDGALAELARADARAAALATAETRYEEVVRVERLRLDTGVGVQSDWLLARADLLATQAALAEARLGAALARTALARTTGELDLAWIATSFEEEGR